MMYLCQKCDPQEVEEKGFRANIVKTKRNKKEINYKQ